MRWALFRSCLVLSAPQIIWAISPVQSPDMSQAFSNDVRIFFRDSFRLFSIVAYFDRFLQVGGRCWVELIFIPFPGSLVSNFQAEHFSERQRIFMGTTKNKSISYRAFSRNVPSLDKLNTYLVVLSTCRHGDLLTMPVLRHSSLAEPCYLENEGAR